MNERERQEEAELLTIQAEYILPPRVSFQQPPLLKSHRKAPEAVQNFRVSMK